MNKLTGIYYLVNYIRRVCSNSVNGNPPPHTLRMTRALYCKYADEYSRVLFPLFINFGMTREWLADKYEICTLLKPTYFSSENSPSPFPFWLILQSLGSLSLRMNATLAIFYTRMKHRILYALALAFCSEISFRNSIGLWQVSCAILEGKERNEITYPALTAAEWINPIITAKRFRMSDSIFVEIRTNNGWNSPRIRINFIARLSSFLGLFRVRMYGREHQLKNLISSQSSLRTECSRRNANV